MLKEQIHIDAMAKAGEQSSDHQGSFLDHPFPLKAGGLEHDAHRLLQNRTLLQGLFDKAGVSFRILAASGRICVSSPVLGEFFPDDILYCPPHHRCHWPGAMNQIAVCFQQRPVRSEAPEMAQNYKQEEANDRPGPTHYR